ncbi:hypothetical protein FWC63_01330 [Candidatus Saccharibacteria bacterium]|nr:hypothetical protein [Candidatus Saccharibacteria bacterium]
MTKKQKGFSFVVAACAVIAILTLIFMVQPNAGDWLAGTNPNSATDFSPTVPPRPPTPSNSGMDPDFERFLRNERIESAANLLVGNVIRFGTPLPTDPPHQGDCRCEGCETFPEILALAQARVDVLPDRWVLPETIYIELTGENRVRLNDEQMSNLRDVFCNLTHGSGILPNYLRGLPPHIIAATMGNIGAASSFQNHTDRENGHFGIFQLGPELFEAYVVWSSKGRIDGVVEAWPQVWNQTAFFWDVLNGWGYETYISQDYSQTIADLLASETVREATIILNSGRSEDPLDREGGFFQGFNLERRIEWAEQIYAQILFVRPDNRPN